MNTKNIKKNQKPHVVEQQTVVENITTNDLTFGQRLADKFAAEVKDSPS